MDPRKLNIGGIVLCGGDSRRMGRCKAWLECGSEYLLQRVVRLVDESAQKVVVAARPGQDLPPLPEGVTLVFDAVAGSGPLAGVAAGLAALDGHCAAAFIVACDHPLLRPRFVERLAELLDEHDAVVPHHGGRLHPLTALYRTSTRGVLAEMLRAGELRATDFAQRCAPRIARDEDFTDCDPRLESLRNFNDRAGYQAMLDALGAARA